MENVYCDAELNDDELQHWGIKNMRWGIRRFQNEDGSLTEAGRKRYNKESEKLSKKEEKIKAKEAKMQTSKATQSKFEELRNKKKELEDREKALKEGKVRKEETDEEKIARREKALKSTDANEIFKNRDVLSTNEINERINRIDTERRLSNMANNTTKTGSDYMESLNKTINKATNLYRSVDNAYSTVANSAIGKSLAKKLGLEPPKKAFDFNEAFRNKDKMTTAELQDFNRRLLADKSVTNEMNSRNARINEEKAAKQAEKEAKAAAKQAEKNLKKSQKQVGEYNKKWQNGESQDTVTPTRLNDSTTNAKGKRDTVKPFLLEDKSLKDSYKYYDDNKNTVDNIITNLSKSNNSSSNNIFGKGTSTFKGWDENSIIIDAVEGRDFRPVNDTVSNATNSNSYNIGMNYIAGLLEDKS